MTNKLNCLKMQQVNSLTFIGGTSADAIACVCFSKIRSFPCSFEEKFVILRFWRCFHWKFTPNAFYPRKSLDFSLTFCILLWKSVIYERDCVRARATLSECACALFIAHQKNQFMCVKHLKFEMMAIVEQSGICSIWFN